MEIDYNRDMKRIVVIGGANVDIQGASQKELVAKDSNIGTISYSFGGVGRNIAENLAHLGNEVCFVGAFGNDAMGQQMYQYCASLGMDMSHSLQLDQVSSTYLAILDGNRDMQVAINDMRILDELTVEHLEKVMDMVVEDDIVVLDTNLSEEAFMYCATHSKAPIYVDPISVAKADKVKPVFSYLTGFKPNEYEAEYLIGKKLTNEEEKKESLKEFLDLGIKKIVISLGRDGVIAGENGKFLQLHHSLVKMKSATGAGDAFMAGFVHQQARNESLEDSIRFASGCSMVAIQSEATVSPLMSEKRVLSIMEEVNMEVKEW